jgi:lysozyme
MPYHGEMLARRTVALSAVTALVVALALPGCGSSEDNTCVDQSSSPLQTACAKSGTQVKGIDVSKWQANIDWSQVKGAGYDFAFIRASDGLYYDDGKYDANWKGAKAAGVVRGTYQFFRPSQDPIAQADLMLNKMAAAGWIEAGDLPCVIDIEVSEGQSNTTIRNKALQWLSYVEQKTGKKPLVYTAAGWSSVLGNALNAYPLWIANYTGGYQGYCPLMPDGWNEWTFWQYTSKGAVPGVGSLDVDKNVFDGNLSALIAYATSGVKPPPTQVPDAGADPCSSASSGNGPYCGVTLGGDPNALYNCQGGSTASKTSCADGCLVMPPGKADQCKTSGSDPCVTASSGNGPYCGKTRGGDPEVLYDCQNGSTASSTPCPYGCVLNPPGTADVCAPAPPPPSDAGTGGSTGTGGGAGQTGSGGNSGWPDSGATIDAGGGGAAGDKAMGAGKGC